VIKIKIELPTDFVYNWLLDIKKKPINPIQRAQIIEEYLKKKKLSQRGLASKLNIPHSTIQDWCLWSRINLEEYEKLKARGLVDTEIYRRLRNNRIVTKHELVNTCKLDYELENFIRKIRHHVNNPTSTSNTTLLIQEAKNFLNRILMRVEKR